MSIHDMDQSGEFVSITPETVKEEQKKSDAELESRFDTDVKPSIVALINERIRLSERSRRVRERQWLKNTNSYRGEDSSDNNFRDSEKSKVYVRTTTVKVKAAYAQITEALFSDNKFPITIQPTIVPEGISQWAHIKTDMDESATAMEQPAAAPEGGIGYAGDGQEPEAGSTTTDTNFLGGLAQDYDKDGETVMEQGLSHAPGAVNISPAKIAAKKMEKKILDHLEESRAQEEVSGMIHEMCMLGTGVMKGPFNVNKELPRYVMDPETGVKSYKPLIRKSFRVSQVSLWNFYPDPSANRQEDLQWVIERHRMNAQQVFDLSERPHFNTKAIQRIIEGKGNYVHRDFETELEADELEPENIGDLYEVLEYWGYMSKEMLTEYNLPITDLIGSRAQVNVWICGDEVLRVVVNPFLPQRIPYYVVAYETDPWHLYGTGVPESMEDSQMLMNGFMRMAVDNLALSGNLVFDIDDSALENGQSMEIYPGKIFRRRSGGQGQAIYPITFPNTAPANMDMFRQVRQLADEETGIPSFAHGQTGVTSPTRTASGMSMLLQNASLNIKTVIRNIDNCLLAPMGQALFRAEMQFGGDIGLQGDLEVKATGSSSLQAKEVRSTRINTFLQLAAQPALAPLIKIPTLLRELAMTLDVDPDEILNSPDEAAIYAALMGEMAQAAMPPQQQQPGGLAPPPGAAIPGGPGFTGNTEGAGNPGGANGLSDAAGI